MVRIRHFLAVAAAASLAPLAGCFAGAGWQRAESHESFQIPALSLESVLVETSNGAIKVRPIESTDDSIRVEVHKVASAPMGVDPAQCLRKIEVVTPVSGDRDEVQEIRWEWTQPQSDCRVTVSFDVYMPKRLAIRATTQNGEIDVAGLTGDCELESNNGAIRALAATTGRFSAETNNGRIQVGTLAREVHISTDNGSVEAALDSLDEITGQIATSNGRIRLVVNEQANICISCRTDNGAIQSQIPSSALTEQQRDGRHKLVEKLGRPEGELTVQTNNGSISIETRTTMPELPETPALPDPAAESTQFID